MNQTEKQRGGTRGMLFFVVGLLAAATLLGFITYRLATRDQQDNELKTALENAHCEHISDDNLCKFFTSWELTPQYSLQASRTENGEIVDYELQDQNHQDFHLKTTDNDQPETIVIGESAFIKNTDDTWHEQTATHEDVLNYRKDNAFNFDKPSSRDAKNAQFSAAGSEACGKLTCFRYEHLTTDGTTTNIWFDNRDFRLQRVHISRDNYTYNATFDYTSDVAIAAPQQSDVLGSQSNTESDQTATHRNLPNTGDTFNEAEYQLWLESRQNQ